jgi:hypothetical protein
MHITLVVAPQLPGFERHQFGVLPLASEGNAEAVLAIGIAPCRQALSAVDEHPGDAAVDEHEEFEWFVRCQIDHALRNQLSKLTLGLQLFRMHRVARQPEQADATPAGVFAHLDALERE